MVLRYRIIIVVILMILISGCTAQYNIKITDDNIEESFSTKIYKTEIPQYTVEGIELDDQLTPFIEQDQHPFFNDDQVVYNKKIIEEDDYRLVKLYYSYKREEYANSTALNKCFENVNYNYQKNYHFILTGAFYCLYSQKLDINVTTNNRVLSNNADKVKGNTYTWHIDNNNVNDVNIKMEIERNGVNNVVANYTLIIVVGLFSLILIIGIIVVLNRRKRHNKI